MWASSALLLALSVATASAGFVKVDIDDGSRYPQGPLPEQASAGVSRRDGDGAKGKGKGFLKLDFETEHVGRRLRPRQLDEDDLDHNITLGTQRSVCLPILVLGVVIVCDRVLIGLSCTG